MADHTPPAAPTAPTGPGAAGPAGLVARSPVTPAPPVAIVAGWEVSTRRTHAALVLTDLTPLAKVQVRAGWDGPMSQALDVPFGRADRGVTLDRALSNGASHVGADALVIGSGPGEWLILAPPGTAGELVDRLQGVAGRAAAGAGRAAGVGEAGSVGEAGGAAADSPAAVDPAVPELVTVTDLTHGRALVRLTGRQAPDLLAKLCAIDLAGTVTPNGTALRTAVARVATDVVRDDLPEGQRSYLLHCERSSGQYLHAVLLDAGADLGIDTCGFTLPGI